jgi:hypothetical protein
MITQPENQIRVELHVHTRYSKDSLVSPEKLLNHCERIGLDKIAVTDHNQIEGAFEAKALAPDRVIVGEEIRTTAGELIGYFMNAWIEPDLEPMEVIARLRSQGAFISVAHPFDTVRTQHWTLEDLLVIAPHVDAIETFNARCLSPEPNRAASFFAKDNHLLATVGSDAHSLFELGRATLVSPDFHDVETFRTALKQAEQKTRLSPFFVHFFSRYAAFRKRFIRD